MQRLNQQHKAFSRGYQLFVQGKRFYTTAPKSNNSSPTHHFRKVRDLIEHQRVYSITADSTLDVALQLMFSHKIRHLPVTDQDNNLVGVVTDRDIRLASSSPILDPEIDIKTDVQKLSTHKVKEVMSKSLYTTNADDSIVDACKVMRLSRRGCLPVVAKDNKQLIGVLTRSTMLDHLIRILQPIPASDVSKK